jgi:uncharacterized protein
VRLRHSVGKLSVILSAAKDLSGPTPRDACRLLFAVLPCSDVCCLMSAVSTPGGGRPVHRIERMYIAPVKSLALASVERALLDKPGIAGDRAFFIIDADGRVVTQREQPDMVQLSAAYDVASDALTIAFPDGHEVCAVPEPQDAVSAQFYGNEMAGAVVRGPWAEALSEFASAPRRLVRGVPGHSFDAFPISICSTGSLAALASAASVASVDPRRFRQNIYITSDTPHAEDEWLGGEVRVGQAVVRVRMRDPRCVMTTYDPDTGATDMDTLKLIANYRTDQPKEANFGVYCTVVQPGEAAVGDAVAPV